MGRRSKTIQAGFILLCCRALLTYLDPGSGSLIVQVLIALVVGALATARLWKTRLLRLIGIGKDDDDDEQNLETLNHSD